MKKMGPPSSFFVFTISGVVPAVERLRWSCTSRKTLDKSCYQYIFIKI